MRDMRCWLQLWSEATEHKSLKAILKYVDINYYFEIYIPPRDSQQNWNL